MKQTHKISSKFLPHYGQIFTHIFKIIPEAPENVFYQNPIQQRFAGINNYLIFYWQCILSLCYFK